MQLVFASGFLIPQTVGKIQYFNGVKQHLEAQGHMVLTHVVPPLGTSKVRAASLADAIKETFPAGKIHIIAHSMGGLDSRYVIAENPGLADRIVSLTTLSTPHHGSPVADVLGGDGPGLFAMVRGFFYRGISRAIGGLGLLRTGAIGDLTKTGAERAPDVASMQKFKHIRFRSYFASGRKDRRPVAILLVPTYELIAARVPDQPNDGVVALESAKYGEFQEPTWPCDHVDMVGYNLDHPLVPNFRHLDAIDAIITKLQAEHPGT